MTELELDPSLLNASRVYIFLAKLAFLRVLGHFLKDLQVLRENLSFGFHCDGNV